MNNSQLPEGYKLTEVGVIPEDWEVRSLGQIGEALIGLTYQPGDVRTHGTLVLRSSNIQGDSLRFEDNVFVEKEIPDRIMVRPGDILICVRNGSRDLIGKTALLDERTAGMTFGAFMAVFRSPNGNFINYIFQSRIIKKQTNEHLGATINQITNKSLNSFLIPLPPTEIEQRSIATALSDMDELLGGLDRLIAKKRDLKQAAMQEFLTGKTRLQGFDGEWEETTLGEIGECIIGLTYKPENVVKYGLLVLRSSNVQNGQLAYADNVYVNLRVADHLVTRIGDILICVRNGSRALIGKCAVINANAAGLTFGAFMSIYRTNYWRFIAHTFQSDDIQKQIRDNIGATINQITNKDMKAFRVLLPPENEQIAIASILSDMDTEIAAIEQRRNKTRNLKQAMMQELLTGRIRLV